MCGSFFMQKKSLFSTPVWLVPPAKEFSDQLPLITKAILDLSPDKNGVDKANYASLKSLHNGWRIDDPHKLDSLKILGSYMVYLSNKALSDQSLDKKQLTLTSWLNVHNKFGFNNVHHHASSLLSGVIYIAAPQGSGDLHIRDPRLGPYFSTNSLSRSGDFVVTPKSGFAVLFPGFLEHFVAPSEVDGRISVAFNVGLL